MIYVQKLNQAFHRDYFNLIFFSQNVFTSPSFLSMWVIWAIFPNISEFTRKKQFEGLASYKDIRWATMMKKKGKGKPAPVIETGLQRKLRAENVLNVRNDSKFVRLVNLAVNFIYPSCGTSYL